MQKHPFDSGWEYTTEVGTYLRPPTGWQPVDSAARCRGLTGRARTTIPTGSAGGYAWSGQVAYRKVLEVPESWRDRQRAVWSSKAST